MPSSSPSCFDDAEHSAGIDETLSFATRRFDSPHLPGVPVGERALPEPAEVHATAAVEPAQVPVQPIEDFEIHPQAIRAAHEDDLIGFLQQWSEDLDERSARLHADIAAQERRERAFRLWMQNQRAEWEQKMSQCEELHRQAEARARRLAFSG